MGEKIRYGIDLGTTNSAIAYFDGKETHILKNRHQMDVTPSVVRISKGGEIKVGLDAYQRLHDDPHNTVSEFKRWIGQKSNKMFKSSKLTMNAEELSSEILKSLFSDVKINTGQDVSTAVITVPAAFGHLQCEATARASSMAGLDDAHLLQEPIAAGIAYGVKPDSKDKNWLVYDLGGGTFDIAVISTREGKLKVLEHKGNNMLGGKDFDRLIVEKIILPKLKEIYEITGPSSNKYSRLVQRLKKTAEEVKKDLSYNEKTVASIFNVGEDEVGELINEEIYVERENFEELIKPYILKTVELCKEAVKDSRLSKDDFESIILVGGSTYIPLVRELLKKEFNIPLNFSLDPITVVARGASVYAATLPIIENESREEVFNGLNIDLDYPNIESGVECFISGYIDELKNNQNQYEVSISDKTGYWSSGWIPLKGGYFEADIKLLENKINNFNIYMRDEVGKQILITPKQFSISTIGCSVGEVPIPYSIGVECVKNDGTSEVDIIFKRSTPLPAKKIVTYRTAKKLSRNTLGVNEDNYIGIKILEGDYPYPEDNTVIAALKIPSEEIKRPIPKGADIELSIEINTSRKMSVEAFIPVINQHFRGSVYVPEPEQPPKLKDIRDGLDEIYEIIDDLELLLENIEDIVDDIENYYKIFKELMHSTEEIYLEIYEIEKQNKVIDIDDLKRINQEIKRIRGELRVFKQEVEKYRPLDMSSGIYQELDNTKELVEAYGDNLQKEQLYLVEDRIEQQIERHDDRGRKKSEEKLERLKWEILNEQEWFWETQFNLLKEESAYVNKDEARRLIEEGECAIKVEDYGLLKGIILDLIKLLPESEVEIQSKKAIKAGIKKSKLESM
ncbi:MAG: hypothetical protein FH751_02525 [Firmicutes bacterium]|nr:hypothetical protein [Bacillota bacterium]